MKKLFTLLFALVFTAAAMQAQTAEELKAKISDLAAAQAEAQAKADALAGEIGGLQKELDILGGWNTGIAGNLGFDANKFSNWAAAANPNSSSSSFGVNLTGHANKLTDKMLWNNKLIIQQGFTALNAKGADNVPSLFDADTHTMDLLNFASLYGYRIHPKFALSALGEFNSSVTNFLNPGVLDIGVGGTWTPTNNLVVVVHPLNYHVAFSGIGDAEASGSLGAKVRADYTNSYVIAGKKFNLSSTLTTFLPYSGAKNLPSPDPTSTANVGPFEYTWINNISFELWRGIGVGVGFGFRGADFENLDGQNYYNMGLSYNL